MTTNQRDLSSCVTTRASPLKKPVGSARKIVSTVMKKNAKTTKIRATANTVAVRFLLCAVLIG